MTASTKSVTPIASHHDLTFLVETTIQMAIGRHLLKSYATELRSSIFVANDRCTVHTGQILALSRKFE